MPVAPPVTTTTLPARSSTGERSRPLVHPAHGLMFLNAPFMHASMKSDLLIVGPVALLPLAFKASRKGLDSPEVRTSPPTLLAPFHKLLQPASDISAAAPPPLSVFG